MGARLFFIMVTTFFIGMNVLLWRTDITGGFAFGSRISPQVVWEKVLTAAGDSSLEVRYKGVKIGTARWQPSVGDGRSNRNDLDPDFPEGMVEKVTGYSLEFDGTFALDESTRFRFGFHLKLSTNYTWQEMGARLALRPHFWEIQCQAADQSLLLRIDDETGPKERRFHFSELQKPEKLLGELGQPWIPGALMSLGLPFQSGPGGGPALGLSWQARNDSITVQHIHIRGYRLQAKILDRHPITIFINPAGEILRLELPGDVVLVNETLLNL